MSRRRSDCRPSVMVFRAAMQEHEYIALTLDHKETAETDVFSDTDTTSLLGPGSAVP
jgi:hypothetical protein